jgi:hypothetical protein
LDLLAAYADHSARYFNFAGPGVIWERPDNSLDQLIDGLLEKGQYVADRIGPWNQKRPGPPPKGLIRINMLTPNGLYLGQGSQEAFTKDPIGGPVVDEATQLMMELIRKAELLRE